MTDSVFWSLTVMVALATLLIGWSQGFILAAGVGLALVAVLGAADQIIKAMQR